jgi:hypothetical protein
MTRQRKFTVPLGIVGTPRLQSGGAPLLPATANSMVLRTVNGATNFIDPTKIAIWHPAQPAFNRKVRGTVLPLRSHLKTVKDFLACILRKGSLLRLAQHPVGAVR